SSTSSVHRARCLRWEVFYACHGVSTCRQICYNCGRSCPDQKHCPNQKLDCLIVLLNPISTFVPHTHRALHSAYHLVRSNVRPPLASARSEDGVCSIIDVVGNIHESADLLISSPTYL